MVIDNDMKPGHEEILGFKIVHVRNGVEAEHERFIAKLKKQKELSLLVKDLVQKQGIDKAIEILNTSNTA